MHRTGRILWKHRQRTPFNSAALTDNVGPTRNDAGGRTTAPENPGALLEFAYRNDAP